jgi:hypothetical protein
MGSSAVATVCSCEFCGRELSARGVRSHEQYCEENPHPGIRPEKQDELRAQGFL